VPVHMRGCHPAAVADHQAASTAAAAVPVPMHSQQHAETLPHCSRRSTVHGMQHLLLLLTWSLCSCSASKAHNADAFTTYDNQHCQICLEILSNTSRDELQHLDWTSVKQTLYLRQHIAAVLTFTVPLCAGPAAAVSSPAAAAALCSLYCNQSAVACLLGPHYVVSVDGSGYWQCKFLLRNHSSLVCMAGKL